MTSGINNNSLICNPNPYGCTAGQQTQWFPPSFVPATTQDTAQSLGQRYENIDLRYSQPYEPIPNSRQVFDQQQQALQLMATTIGSTISKGFVMPRKEYMTFHGDPLDYPSFITNFKTNVEDVESNPNIRRNYLIQLCEGKAKEAISGTVMLPPAEGYQKAKSILHEMFGQTHIVAASHIDRVTKGPIIRENENDKLMQLARDVENCGMNLSKLGYQADINSRHNISAIVLRLPKYLRSEWAKEANNLRERNIEPDFAALTKFIVNKAKLANTEYGRLVNIRIDGERNKPRPHGRQQRNVANYQVTNDPSNKEQEDQRNELSRLKCSFCSKSGHSLEKCFKFQEKSYAERKKFVSEKGLCNLCLLKGHFANSCKRGRRCFIAGCGKRHHPLLHSTEFNQTKQEERPKENSKDKDQDSLTKSKVPNAQTGHCGATDMARKQVCLRVIPVKVFGKDGSREKVTYAIRDEGSNTTLIKESLVSELGLEGCPVDFKLTTMNKISQESGRSHFLYVQGMGQKDCLEIPNALSIRDLSVARGCIPTKEDINRWSHLDGVNIPELKNTEVTLLIGTDVPEAHWKLEERRGRRKEPYAIRTPLGWSVAGPMGTVPANDVSSFFVRKEDELLGQTVEKMFQMDFSESSYSESPSMSLEDKRAVSIMEESLDVVNGHYQLDLPFRDEPRLPNNRSLAERRLRSLKIRLKRDQDLYEKYKKGINDNVEKGYASKVEEGRAENNPVEGNIWYLPHHPVLHPQKPQKPRIVFDCAAKYEDVSLNDRLLQGPEMTNKLVGVLSRFRQDPVAFTADIEAMFCQVMVSPAHRDFLRFLWWRDGDYDEVIEEYQMLVHPFGATSSPSCAGFCLRKTAEEFESEFDLATIETIRRNFYVDDCLKSASNTQKAIRLVEQLRGILARRSFRLTKFVSNDLAVLASVPEEERAESVVNLDLEELPVERALGVEWNVQDDVFSFRTVTRKKAPSRRGILSDVSSMYDPLGFASPFILPAKRLLQQLCKDKVEWDEGISPTALMIWERWLDDLPLLQEITVPRYFKSHQLDEVKNTQLHHFSDASNEGYGTVAYLRFVDVNDKIHCSLVMGKSRVAPMKPTTIPRLELTAATVSVKQHCQIREEIDLPIDSTVFWTDSTCVLQYINNEASRFKTFVANRIATIHNDSVPSQWRYVNSESNPADYASRGLRPTDQYEIDQWINGPDFLRNPEKDWPKRPEGVNVLPDHKLEWKRNVEIYETQKEEIKPLDVFIQYYSSWYRLLKGVAWFNRFLGYIRRGARDGRTESSDASYRSTGAGIQPLTVDELKEARRRLIRYVQREAFPEEIACLKRKTKSNSTSKVAVKKSSRCAALSPFLADDGLLRVGGRLDRATISFDAKHPAIIPSKHHIVELVIRHYHEQEGHSGVRVVLSAIQREFWIIQGRSRVRWIISKCIHCRKKYASPCEQKMAPLPTARVTVPEHPFASTGIDYFGPLTVKRGRSQVKRYGCVFTCLAMRAVHIEVAHSLDAESFLCAFSRFIARRGVPKEVFSDNGTNFIGASGILKEEFKKIQSQESQGKIIDRLRTKEISWHFNPPLASHTGGIWERMIRSIRRILAALTSEQSIDDEVLLTLMAEIEKILNDRPLTRNEGQVDDLDPLTPSKLLLLRSNACLPPGVFVGEDRYSKRWRQAQLLANSFWKRWLSEYLPSLQQRQKWLQLKRNVRVKDLVLMVDKRCSRGQWPLAIVEKVFPDKDGVVRQVMVRTKSGNFKRHVRELCLIEEAKEEDK
jgi:hypothetical protein